MKFLSTITSAAFLLTSVLAQQNTFTINSLEGVTVCRPSLISWLGGSSPYYLSILPANQPNAQALVDFGKQDSTSLTWLVNLPAGSSGFLYLRDTFGAIAQSAAFTVANSSDTSCVAKPLSASSGAAATGSTGASAAAASTTGVAANKTGTPASATTTAGAVSPFNIGAAAVLAAIALALAV